MLARLENMRVLKVDRGAGPGPQHAARTELRSAGSRTTRTWTGPEMDFSEWKNSMRTAEGGSRAWRREVIGHEELVLDLHSHLPEGDWCTKRELLICRL